MSNEPDDASAKTAPPHDPLQADLATYLEWTGYPTWSAQDAACLLLGFDPDILDPPNEALGLFYQATLARANYQRLRQYAQHAVERRQMKGRAPQNWVEWARSRLLDVPIPPALIEALEQRARAIASNDTKTLRASKRETAARHAKWQARAAELHRADPEKTIRAIAYEIYKDDSLNPPHNRVGTETIRRHLSFADLTRGS